MHESIRDIRYAFRQLLRSPTFTIAAVLCLALGIGANAATFSFARSFLFQTAPIAEPDRLVRMYLNYASGIRFGSWSYLDLLDLQETAPELFEGVTGDGISTFSLSVDGANRRLFGFYVTGNYFAVLGVDAAVGRTFLPEEDVTDGTHPVTVISHGLWQRAFGADPAVAGQTLLLNGTELTVIGVAPEGFVGHNTAMGAELWVPFRMLPVLDPVRSLEARGNHWLQSATVRLRPSVTGAQAKEAADALFVRLEEMYPDTNTGITIDVYPESQAALHPAVRGGFVAMITLMGAVVGFVLLLACANVAGLLLARATARRREVGIRLALGARKRRLVRQLLTESLVLSTMGGAIGLGLGGLLIGLVKSFRPPTELPLHIDAGLDAGVILFTLGATMLTGLVFGLAPALQAGRQDLVEALKDGTPGAGAAASRWRRVLVVGQVALSLVLLIAAGMVLRSLDRIRALDIGFEPDGVAVASVDPALQGYDAGRLEVFWRDLRREIERAPGVDSMGYALTLPLSLMNNQSSILPEGYEVPEGQSWPSLDMTSVEQGYFETMGIPLLGGRFFDAGDDADAAPVLVVNEAFAERFWPDEDPIGKTAQRGGREHTVVGLVSTGKYFSLGEAPKPFYYQHMPQAPTAFARYAVVRTSGTPTSMLEVLRRAVRALDPTLPVSDLSTMDGALGMAYLPARMASGVVGSFALLALVLAAVGLYGVIAYSVAQQVREIGLRMALGADARHVLGMVLRRGLGLTASGLALGVAGGYLLSRAAAGVLYGVSPTDPVAYAAATAVLLAATVTATLLPAVRATHTDPLIALRSD